MNITIPLWVQLNIDILHVRGNKKHFRFTGRYLSHESLKAFLLFRKRHIKTRSAYVAYYFRDRKNGNDNDDNTIYCCDIKKPTYTNLIEHVMVPFVRTKYSQKQNVRSHGFDTSHARRLLWRIDFRVESSCASYGLRLRHSETHGWWPNNQL